VPFAPVEEEAPEFFGSLSDASTAIDQNDSVPFIWIKRGEASPPRNDPRMLVGTLTVLMILPNVGLETLASGWSKLG
jgi:hypothetical protein